MGIISCDIELQMPAINFKGEKHTEDGTKHE